MGVDVVGQGGHNRCSRYLIRVSNHQRFGVINGDPVSTDEFHNVRPERRATLKRANRGLKMVGHHAVSIPQKKKARPFERAF